jgi:uncharacterized membrane protein
MKSSFSILRLFVSLVLVAGFNQAQAGLKPVALDSLGGNSSLAAGINNSGVVVGTTLDGDGFPRSATWTGVTPTDARPGDWLSWGKAINNSGQIAGSYGTTYGRFATGSAYASPHSDGSIGHFGVSDTAANDINNNGVAVGYAYTQAWAGEPLYPMAFYGSHAVMWNGTTSVDLHPQSAQSSQANAINDAGSIVGSVDGDAALWSGGTLTKLGQGVAIDINNNGVIAGTVNDHAVIWNGNVLTILGEGTAAAINAVSQVVGSANGHAFLWDGGQAIDLNNFLSVATRNAGWILEQAVGINDLGWIVANAYNTNTMMYQAYVLSPAPEPSTYLMLLLGLGWIAWKARLRNRAMPSNALPA